MAQFTEAITGAIAIAQQELDEARADGDVDAAVAHEGRLEDLRRLAADNDVSTGVA